MLATTFKLLDNFHNLALDKSLPLQVWGLVMGCFASRHWSALFIQLD